MRFTVSSALLLEHLQAISRVISSKNTLPILDCFLFELKDNILTVTVSDKDMMMKTELAVNDSDGNVRFAVTAKTLLEAFKEIPEQPLDFYINTDENLEITIQYQNGKYRMMGSNADEYPTSVAFSATNSTHLTISADVLSSSLNSVSFATADDELRPVMNGVYFDMTPECMVLVASDAHKLVRCKLDDFKSEVQNSFILPKKPVQLLKGLLPKESDAVSIDFDERHAMFKMEKYQMVCRLIEGRYPNYNSVIPRDNPYKLIIDRTVLLGAIKRVAICSSKASALIKFHLEQNKLVISSEDVDFSNFAEEALVCQYDGAIMNIGFKAEYIMDILNNIDSEQVIVELADPSRAGLVLPFEQKENEELLMLLMPMMLND